MTLVAIWGAACLAFLSGFLVGRGLRRGAIDAAHADGYNRGLNVRQIIAEQRAAIGQVGTRTWGDQDAPRLCGACGGLTGVNSHGLRVCPSCGGVSNG